MSLLEVGVELEFKGEGVEKAFVKKHATIQTTN
jgi:hypothetical protein